MDNIEYLDYGTLGGLNLWIYCNNNPIMNVDPYGNFVISLAAIVVGAIIGAVVGAGVGAGIGFGAAAYIDYNDDGIWFNRNWKEYLGAILGGAIAGKGIGIAGTFGAGLGIAMWTDSSLLVANVTVSAITAFSISSVASFTTGSAGYLL